MYHAAASTNKLSLSLAHGAVKRSAYNGPTTNGRIKKYQTTFVGGSRPPKSPNPPNPPHLVS